MKIFDIFNIFDIFLSANINMFSANICFIEIGTDGTWFGKFGTTGELSPNATVNEIVIETFKWKANGTFVLAFGDGTEKLTNIDSILVYHPTVPDGNRADWDSVNEYYTFTDVDLAAILTIDNACFYIEFDPTILADWNFILQTGTRE